MDEDAHRGCGGQEGEEDVHEDVLLVEAVAGIRLRQRSHGIDRP